MKVELALPPSKRDLRLDLFRGLANWLMFLGHVSTSLLAWFSFRNYGFSDGADLFVFISGYTSALVYGRRMLENGFVFGTTRLMRRVWQIYAAHILLFVFYLASVHLLSNGFSAPELIDRFNVAPLVNAPVETITQGLLLRYKPVNLDVLPLYVILMGAFAPVLWLMLRHRNWVMLGSVALYFGARQFGWNLPSYPSGVWYFNPFTWQLLFVLGAWLALGGASTLHFLVRSNTVLLLGVAYLLFAAVMTLAGLVPEFERLLPRALFEAFNPNDKTNLAPYRFLHFVAIVILVIRFVPKEWPGLEWKVFDPLIVCGQQSLAVFCVGVFLSFVGHFELSLSSGSLFAQIFISVTGIAIMTIVAYYISWSKRQDKPLKPPAPKPTPAPSA